MDYVGGAATYGFCGGGLFWIGRYLLQLAGGKPIALSEQWNQWCTQKFIPFWRAVFYKQHRQIHNFEIHLRQSPAQVEQVIDSLPPVSRNMLIRFAQMFPGGQSDEIMARRQERKIYLCAGTKGIQFPFVGLLEDEEGGTRIVGKIRPSALNRSGLVFLVYFYATFALAAPFVCVLLAVSIGALLRREWFLFSVTSTLGTSFWAQFFLSNRSLQGLIHRTEPKVAQFWRDQFDAEVELTPRRSWIIF